MYETAEGSWSFASVSVGWITILFISCRAAFYLYFGICFQPALLLQFCHTYFARFLLIFALGSSDMAHIPYQVSFIYTGYRSHELGYTSVFVGYYLVGHHWGRDILYTPICSRILFSYRKWCYFFNISSLRLARLLFISARFWASLPATIVQGSVYQANCHCLSGIRTFQCSSSLTVYQAPLINNLKPTVHA